MIINESVLIVWTMPLFSHLNVYGENFKATHLVNDNR